MSCESIYKVTYDIVCNGTGFWVGCVGNQFVMKNGVVIDDHFVVGEPIAFWLDNKIGFAVNPKTIPAGVKSALSVRRFLVMDGVQNPNPSPAWLELHTWQLLGQGANGETIIITVTTPCNLYKAASLLIEAGAIWGGDLDSGGSVSTKCGGDIITVENRLVANFLAIDIGGTAPPPTGGSMTTVTRWTGNVGTVKPLRDSPGGDATGVTLSKGQFVKADERVDRWIRLIEPGVGAGLWASYTWLTNFEEIQEEITDPTVPPPSGKILPFILDVVGYMPFSGELEPDA